MTYAIKATGTINNQHHLLLDEALPLSSPKRVRVLVFFTEDDDIEQEWIESAASNPAFDFLNAPEEDIYTLTDGKEFHD